MKGRGPLADEIERRMLERGLTAKGLSLAAKLGATYVGDLLRGRSTNPRSDAIAKLAEKLGCTVEDLQGAKAVPMRRREKTVDPQEAEHLDAFRAVPKEMREIATEQVRALGRVARVRSKKLRQR